MALFNRGKFKLHSGSVSDFKIDCDFLTKQEVAALAHEVHKRVPVFGRVEGVPTGGLRLAAALEKYATGKAEDPLLIVDDVLTSGASMEEHRAGREAMGVVLFARKWPMPLWIRALFLVADEQPWWWV